MSDVARALGISAGILIPVVIFIVLITIAVVRRGETGEADAGHDVPTSLAQANATAAAPAAKAAKPTGPVNEEVSVSEILLFGTGLFVLSILALLALSLIQHMN
jgi:hypothetical protein